MFGIGFTELLLISIVAILFLGPDKLPQALVEMAKFIKSVKRTVNQAKSSIEEEMRIGDLTEEALNYKKQLNDATQELKNFKNIGLDDLNDEITYDDKKPLDKKDDAPQQVESKNETVTLKKKDTKPKKSDS